MSNVVSLSEVLLDKGEAEFGFCPCCLEQSIFLPIVRRNRTGDYITSLLCVGPFCEGDGIVFPVSNGYIEDAEDMGAS